jgi:hypothetical protein
VNDLPDIADVLVVIAVHEVSALFCCDALEEVGLDPGEEGALVNGVAEEGEDSVVSTIVRVGDEG